MQYGLSRLQVNEAIKFKIYITSVSVYNTSSFTVPTRWFLRDYIWCSGCWIMVTLSVAAIRISGYYNYDINFKHKAILVFQNILFGVIVKLPSYQQLHCLFDSRVYMNICTPPHFLPTSFWGLRGSNSTGELIIYDTSQIVQMLPSAIHKYQDETILHWRWSKG